ncbi:sulfate transporter6 [Zea mays]|uniref:Putative sulfate transporter 3.5 n=1 Tax=Zea mays TaxID=4577 RepID=C0P3Z9_MAIZE|nr:sulfate transporter6 [Zea mays]ACN27715.1 unknown [Zea mays]ONM38589.1 putative sulfate transporter 3.5 [Zea mays]|eukprot:NP_001168294.1 sulfate transporter6 [Zea mays]
MGPAAGDGDRGPGAAAEHKVNLSARQPFVESVRTCLAETFFPDDPFRGLGSRPPAARAWGALKYFVPALEWAPRYTAGKFKYDLLAGVTIASLAIPQGISYAKLANLPPIIGLYSSFVPPLLYAVFGSSNNLAVGTVAAASLLLASIIETEVPPEENPQLYLQLFYTAAFFTGVFQTALGVFRLGLIVDFLSRSTITGFMGGTATIIILQQLKGMLGMKHFTPKTDLVSVMRSIFYYRHEWRWQSLVLGICFLLLLLLSKHLRKKKPNLFWVSAIAPFLIVVIGGVFAFLVKGDEHGIPIVGDLKKGINPLSISQLTFTDKHVNTAMKAGFLSGILALAEGIAVGRSLALVKNEQIDGNKEMIAFGIMNIAGSFTSCYLTTGPFSKSAVNFHAGCRTPMSNVVMSVCILLVLLFLAPLFKYTPLVALSSIIVVAMIGLIKVREFCHLYRVDKFDFCICMVAFIGVVFFTMVIGLSASVGLSVVRALLHVARPSTCKLGSVAGGDIFRDVRHYPHARSVPNVLVLQLGSPIYFVNAGYLRERILRWAEEEENGSKIDGQDLQYVVLDLAGVTSIDNTGIGMLVEVHKSLDRKGIRIALTNPRLEVTEKLVLSGYIKDIIGEEWVFLTVKDAITACRYALQRSRSKDDGEV